MEKHELANLESRVKELTQGLADAANDAEFKEFLLIIHRPGWTTVAETHFVAAIVESMHAHTKTLATLKKGLLAGSRAVGTK